METTAQPPRCRRVLKGILRTLAVLTVLTVLSAVGYESWRQWDIRQAKAEYTAAAAAVVEPFTHVEDWPAWWHSRVEGDWGGDEFHKWATDIYDQDELLLDDGQQYTLEAHLEDEEPEYGSVDEEALLKFLERTDDIAGESEALLRFDTLSGVPKLDDDNLPEWGAFIETIQASSMLYQRVHALTWLERYDDAWSELRRMYELAGRQRDASCLIEDALNASWELNCHQALEYLCMHSSPPAEVANLFPFPEPPEIDYRHIHEGELAYWSSLFRAGLEDPNEDDLELNGEEWFAWLWMRGEDCYSNPAEDYREYAKMHLDNLELYNAAQEGREPEGVDEHMMSAWRRPDQSNASRWINRQRANLLVALRTHEAEGNQLGEFEFDEDKYPDLKLRHTEDGVEIRFTRTERVGLGLDANANDELLEPRTIPPLN